MDDRTEMAGCFTCSQVSSFWLACLHIGINIHLNSLAQILIRLSQLWRANNCTGTPNDNYSNDIYIYQWTAIFLHRFTVSEICKCFSFSLYFRFSRSHQSKSIKISLRVKLFFFLLLVVSRQSNANRKQVSGNKRKRIRGQE